jgi:hypothetical protein
MQLLLAPVLHYALLEKAGKKAPLKQTPKQLI